MVIVMCDLSDHTISVFPCATALGAGCEAVWSHDLGEQNHRKMEP